MKIKASPTVQRLARAKGIDLDRLAQNLGRDFITEHDLLQPTNVETPLKHDPLKHDPWDYDASAYGAVQAVEISKFNQLAAANLNAANQKIAQVTHYDKAELTQIEAFRKSLKIEAQERNLKLTTLCFHIKALGKTLQEHPKFNASLSACGTKYFLKKYVDIAIAVDTEHGLMVPVIRAVDRKGLWQLATEIKDLSTRARQRKIRPQENGGASMTITNLGSIGGVGFTPIVNPPEAAILGISKASLEPVWSGKNFEPLLLCPLNLSYDHRLINGAQAAHFMAAYCAKIKEPRLLLT